MKKKIFSLLFTLCLLLGSFSLAMGTAAADSSAAYTEISTADELIALMGNPAGWSGNYRLAANIDLTGVSGQAPIGNGTTAFTGIFDGNGKTISGIDITIDGQNCVGLFGVIMDAEIRDLTTSGQITVTGASFTGGIIGAITGSATVENCINNVTVNAVARVGGVVGCVVLNNALAGVPSVSVNSGATVLIKNCVNNASVTGIGARVGGIVGSASVGKYGDRHVTIENCVNNAPRVKGIEAVGGILGFTDPLTAGATITVKGCINNGAVEGTKVSATLVGGIVGRITLTSGGTTTATVTECMNTGEIIAPAQSAGIVGYVQYKNSGGVPVITKCYNTGAVNATGTTTSTAGADAGGILGVASAVAVTVENCFNAGAINGAGGVNVGGIVARTYGANSVKNCYNSGTTTSGTATVRAIVSNCSSTTTCANNYYTAGGTDTRGTEVTGDSIGLAASYPNLDPAIWTFTTTGPELTVFHEHIDADNNGECDACGINMACEHTNATVTTIVASTCSVHGTGTMNCSDCGYSAEVELEFDPDNHVARPALSLVDGKVKYTCDCGVSYTETTDALTTVYIAAEGDMVEALPTVTAGTFDNPFGDFDLALRYAGLVASANGAATVVIKDTVTIPATYSTPAFDGMVTITGGKMILGGASTFNMNGALTFRDIQFDVDNPGSGAYIYAQNHKLVMDTGITMVNGATVTGNGMTVNAVKMYILGGFLNGTHTMNSDITVRSGEYWFIGGAGRCTSGTMTLDGTTKITLGASGEENIKAVWLNTFSTGAEHVGAPGLKGTLIVDGKVDVARYNIVNQNGGGAEYPRTVDIVLMGDINPNHTAQIDVVGSTDVKGCDINLYVDERVSTAIADANVFYGDNADASIATLQLNVSKYSYAQYCLAYLNGHIDADQDGNCDLCGGSMVCSHPEERLDYIVIKNPTCIEAGLQEVWCTACGERLDDYLPDPDGMTHTVFKYRYNNEGSYYELICADCEEVVVDGIAEPVVYLDNWQKVGTGTGLSAEVGSDANYGNDVLEPVYTLEEAVRRLAETGGTIYMLDRYVVGENITLPAYNATITITTAPEARNTAGNPNTGFVITKHGVAITLGGPTKFETLIFNGGKTDGCNTLVIAGNWNDVEFGERLVTYGNAYFVAGRQFPTTDDATEKSINLTFARTSAQKISSTVAAVTFFDRIILGDRVNTAGITVSNKTVNATFNNTTVMSLWAGTTSTAAQNAQMINCSTTLNINQNAYINTIRSGSGNTDPSGGTAYMDSLTVNLNDNARVYGGFVPRNIRNMTLNISGTANGRDSLYNGIKFGPIALTDTYLASSNYTGNETVTINYTSHSFKAGVAAPSVVGYADGNVNINCIDECEWVDGETITPATLEAPGVITKTCTICGTTKEEEIPALKARLTQKSITAMTDTASGESTIRFIARLEVAEGVTVAKIGTYISLVAIGGDGAPSTAGAKIVAKEQTVSGAAPTSFALDLTGIPADQSATSVYAWAYADLSDGTRMVLAFAPISVSALLGALR